MAKDTTNLLPYSLEAEQSVLGSILIDKEFQFEIASKVKAEDFFVESHKFIFNAMFEILSDSKPVDLVTLIDVLSKMPSVKYDKKSGSDNLDLIQNAEKKTMLERVGNIDYLTEIIRSTPSAANYEYYVDIVKRDSVLRKLIRCSDAISKDAISSDNGTKSVAYAEKLIYDISEQLDTSSLTNVNEHVDGVLDTFQKIQSDKNYLQGLHTGFTALDDLTNGLHKGNLIILAARPSVGKTTLAMNIVENVAIRHNAVCAVFALEMTKEELTERMLCSIGGVSGQDAKKGKLDSEEWKKLWNAQKIINSTKIFIDDTSMTTIPDILSKCRRLKSMQGGKLDLIVVDHIQLMNAVKSSESRQSEITEISRGLKMIAKELEVPVIALSQLNRASETGKRRPQLSDLRESGAIEQDADIVMFIHRPDRAPTEDGEPQPKNRVEAEIIISKNRSGACESFKLLFKGEQSKFVNIVYNSPEPPAYIATPKSSSAEVDYDDGFDSSIPVGEPPAENPDEDIF
ncbi:MAG: replicative DNA helicase [Clostridia bacterium]|nr:replicative DNA helicase [Clostridia bacterium]